MAKTLLLATIFTIISAFVSKAHGGFARRLSQSDIEIDLGKEKLTHLHFYFHDIVSGSNPTATEVAKSPLTDASPTLFGAVFINDDPLTVGPEINSTLVGKAQGMYASTSQTVNSLLVALNLVFLEGKYNGSTITLLGRNEVLNKVREMPIVGGTGVFRFVRGYVLSKTYFLNLTSLDTIVEFDVYAIHY